MYGSPIRSPENCFDDIVKKSN